MNATFGFKKRRDTIKIVIPEESFKIVSIDYNRFILVVYASAPIKYKKKKYPFYLASSATLSKNSTIQEEIGNCKIKIQKMLDNLIEFGYLETRLDSKRLYFDLSRWREFDFNYKVKSRINALNESLKSRCK